MIAGTNSFSKSGGIIQRKLSMTRYATDDQFLQRILSRKMLKEPKERKPKHIEGFDKVPSRQKLNSFQIYNTKDSITQANYKTNFNEVLPRSASYSIRKQQQKRLPHFDVKPYYDEHHVNCKKHQQTANQNIMTVRDLQNARKTFHSLNFQKQTPRPFDQSLRKLKQKEEIIEEKKKEMDLYKPQTNSHMNKTHSIHAFGSYTQREFLSQKTIKCAPSVSGIDAYKINPQKFKSLWKTTSAPRFQAMAKKTISRHDSIQAPWYTKVAYNVKQTNKKDTVRQFHKQTMRKDNIVKSSYPMRIAI